VFDFEQADGRAFLVMELAERGSLRDEIRSGALWARPVAQRIADARAAASALEAIHRAGIIHRDLSPQNMLRMADGRLVLSDFGLAVDTSDTTNSVYGGTVAYMAPEVLRGGKATFASDIWSLGVVMHEMVFGAKPRWSECADPAMLEPRLKRRLTGEERAVFETCRACTARDPARRLVREGEVVGMLAESPPSWRWRLRPLVASRRPVLWVGVLSVLAAFAAGVLRGRHGAPAGQQALQLDQSPLIMPTGKPADLTDVSTVLADSPDRINCTRLLPDQRTIRFVAGTPPRAEDVDVLTRQRVPSPLAPSAYAEGCPDLSPDGKRLVFQGHTPDGRPFVFLSERPDGKDAVPVVPAAEPTMASEPTWLPDGEAFSYDVDNKHMGVFSTTEGRVTVLPEPSNVPFVTSFRSVTGGLVFVSGSSEAPETAIMGFSWPLLREERRARYAGFVLDLTSSAAPSVVYFADPTVAQKSQLVTLDLDTRVARRAGRVRDQLIRYPRRTAGGLAFLSVRFGADLFAKAADGSLTRVTNEGTIFSASHCGDGFIIERDSNEKSQIERINRAGVRVSIVSHGPFDTTPACSPDGRTIFYADRLSSTVARCDDGRCRALASLRTHGIAASPDGRRLVLMTFEQKGIGLWLVNSEGGEARYIAETETACDPGWASANTVWISRRRNGKVVWVELDADTGRETGTVTPGLRDCSDGKPDPASPVNPDIRIVYNEPSQIRLVDEKLLAQN
jgi:hypothetical protein